MRLHHYLLLWMALAWGCDGSVASTAAAEKPPAVDVKQLLAECTGCHKPGPLDLSPHPRSKLRAKLAAIRDGKAKHATDLTKLSDAQLDALSAGLASKE